MSYNLGRRALLGNIEAEDSIGASKTKLAFKKADNLKEEYNTMMKIEDTKQKAFQDIITSIGTVFEGMSESRELKEEEINTQSEITSYSQEYQHGDKKFDGLRFDKKNQVFYGEVNDPNSSKKHGMKKVVVPYSDIRIALDKKKVDPDFDLNKFLSSGRYDEQRLSDEWATSYSNKGLLSRWFSGGRLVKDTLFGDKQDLFESGSDIYESKFDWED